MDPLIIIGAGHGAFAFAGAYRKLDTTRRILLITADGGDAYSKPMLSNAFAQNKAFDDLVTGTYGTMTERLNLTLLRQTAATSIDTAARCVHTEAGAHAYSDLVLALGATPVRLPVEGDGAEDAVSVNTIDDYRAFRARLEGARRVLIMGAGLIGCEFANDLLHGHGGIAPVVVDPAPLPLASLVPPALGGRLRDALARAGVTWKLGTVVQRIDRLAPGYRVTLADGSHEDVDVVLSAVGLRPRTELAAAAGIEIGRGILVDAHGQTSAPNVYAVGDCAQYAQGGWLPYIRPILVAARSIAATVAGTRTPIEFPAMPILVKTPACPIAIVRPPVSVAGQWQPDEAVGGTAGGAGGACHLFRDEAGILHGFALSEQAVAGQQALLKALGTPYPDKPETAG
ncbi:MULTISPECIES: FAD-dependent oxidoreductase [unclassified Cupriavidus]|uniref:FAD-dependent oxidoreductase n=1 Tax=Cupriavidus sp. H19C3 TaxID=3241603 RepID=UPI003BF8E30B